MDTMTRINQLSNERQNLWRLAGQQPLTSTQRARVQEITDTLYSLWDVHRREVAGARPVAKPDNLINIRDTYQNAA